MVASAERAMDESLVDAKMKKYQFAPGSPQSPEVQMGNNSHIEQSRIMR